MTERLRLPYVRKAAAPDSTKKVVPSLVNHREGW
jgi:hypothetical protein